MGLPTDFQFNQANLQDFCQCERRFQLRYLRHVAWPAVLGNQALETEKHVRLGVQFHQMVRQNLIGISSETIQAATNEDTLRQWWSNYAGTMQGRYAGTIYPEWTLAGELQGYGLICKYDLITIHPGTKVSIFDWKTTRRRTTRGHLAARLQTRTYMFLIVAAGAFLNGGQPVHPEQVEMTYWFANYPNEPVRFCYSPELYQADHRYLVGLVEEIDAKGDRDFACCTDERVCAACGYRSLCGQEATDGYRDGPDPVVEPEGEVDFAIDDEQSADIES